MMRMRSLGVLFFLPLLLCAKVSGSDFAAQRERMVKMQLIWRGVNDPRVLAAMGKVPREEFVPEPIRDRSYHDRPLPIGYDQTISQPFIVALMTQRLRVRPGEKVLEIGTGSGYQAAVLHELGARVFTIEIVAPLAKRAAATLQRLGYKNVHIKIGDGYQGCPEEAPFDAVIVTCAPERVPGRLVQQTKEGGRIVIPVGAAGAQKLYLFVKKEGRLQERVVLPVQFVPMTGEVEKPRPN